MKFMRQENNFKNKKVLVFGLGLLGGGVATTNWLLKHGAKVTVTDLKTKDQLAPSLKKIKGNVVLRLGGHSEDDIKNNDIVVFNPDISVKNPYVALARKLKKRVENEATIFYELCDKPIIAITGTRGKTTTATWTQHLLGRGAILAGNRYDHALLDALDKVRGYRIVVNELPSYHLEFFPFTNHAPHIALITNLSRDHMNRHGNSIEEYAATKGNIFRNQSPGDHLILNRDDAWTEFFLDQKPKAKLWFFGAKQMRTSERGVFVRNGVMYFRDGGVAENIVDVRSFIRDRGQHNLKNFLATALAAHLAGASWKEIVARMRTLPGIPFRQEVVFKSPRLAIVNDTTATSAEGGIAAIERFGSPSTILIAGGTDRGLEYASWAKAAHKKISPKNLILLTGSATDKMLQALGKSAKDPIICEALAECFDAALSRARTYRKALILFSPSAKSFEKFKNEFDRGEQFNVLVRRANLGRQT
jgi:UDP-N-acetylmuramoylalanine--D-glutamate ligase